MVLVWREVIAGMFDGNGQGRPRGRAGTHDRRNRRFPRFVPRAATFCLLAIFLLFGGTNVGRATVLLFDDASVPVGDNPQSIAAGDCDGNGLPDVIASNFDSNDITLFQADSTGTLVFEATLATPPQPSGASCGDFTGDGIGDVAVASWASGTVTIFQGDGNGQFTATRTVAVGSQPRSVATADLNLDGAQDLVVANAQSSDLTLLFGDGTGSFPTVGTVRLPAVKQTNRPRSAQVADFNRDGYPDIAVASQGDPSLRLLLGDGNGFRIAAVELPMPRKLVGLATGDLDGDNIPDLATLSQDAVLSLYTGSGTGTFTARGSIPLRPAAKSIALADFNQDGLADVAVSYSDANALQVIMATGPAEFPGCGGTGSPFLCPMSTSSPVLNALADAVPRIGPDGTSQLVFLDKRSRTLALLESVDLASPTVVTLATLPADPEHLLLADLNNDGVLDAVVTMRAGRRNLFMQVFSGTPDGGYDPQPPRSSGCGNGVLDAGEQCDDGDTRARDGCSPTCAIELERGVVSLDAADLNGDGWQDLLVTDGRRNLRLLSGNGEGQFKEIRTLTTLARKTGAVVADFSGDGAPDIVYAPKKRRDGTLALLVNDGAGQFTRQTVLTAGVRGPFLAADFDRNGYADLVFVQRVRPKGLTALFGDAAGPLRTPRTFVTTPRSVQTLRAADFNEDGFLDVLVSSSSAREQPLLFLGSRTLPVGATSPVPIWGAGSNPIVADVDEDQHQDLVTCGGDANLACRVLYGNGAAGFASTPFPAAPSIGRDVRGAIAADLDGDGIVDLGGVSRRDNRLVLHFRGEAPGSVVLPTGTFPSTLNAADFNGDGWEDLVVANEGSQDLSLFTNLGNRQFNTLARIRLPALPSGPLALAVGDVNGDGRTDVGVVQANGALATVLVNTGSGLATWTSLTTGSEPRDIAFGNFNGDGVLDIVTANRGSNTISVFLSGPDGTFGRTDLSSGGLHPWDVEAPELNRDGAHDIVVLNEQESPTATVGNLVTLLNDGTGGFLAPSNKLAQGREFPSRLCVGDFNADGNADVAVASIYTGDVMVLHGTGDGRWGGERLDFPLGDAVTSVTCSDVDRDGRTDITFSRRRAGDVGVIVTTGLP